MSGFRDAGIVRRMQVRTGRILIGTTIRTGGTIMRATGIVRTMTITTTGAMTMTITTTTEL
jgi:hypothetical protein